jgi:hypothetical protein
MKIIEPDKGAIVMGDKWDYKLWKAESAWDLAMRIIPKEPSDIGDWTEDSYLKKSQEILKNAQEVINAIFKEDVGK